MTSRDRETVWEARGDWCNSEWFESVGRAWEAQERKKRAQCWSTVLSRRGCWAQVWMLDSQLEVTIWEESLTAIAAKAQCRNTASSVKKKEIKKIGTVTDGRSLAAQSWQLKALHKKWHTYTLSSSTQGHTDGRCYTNTSHWSVPYYQLSQPVAASQ